MVSLDPSPADTDGPERATFILRFVRERRAGSDWRGEVEYVQLGERLPAADPAHALGQLQIWLNAVVRGT